MMWLRASVIAMTMAAVAHSFAPTATWLSYNDTWSPRDKFGFYCEVDSSGSLNAYFFGGREATLTYRSDVYTYSTSTGQWTQIYPGSNLAPVAAMAFAKIGNTLWTFGGQTTANAGAGSTDALYSLDLTVLEWRAVTASGSLPSPRRKMASWTVGSTIFIFGGLTGIGALNDIYSLDTTTLVWTKYTPAGGIAPSRRFDTLCQYYAPRGSAICFGGTTDTGDSNEVWEYVISTSTWTLQSTAPAANVPSARRLAMGAFRNSELAVWGGWDSTAGGYVANTAMYFLDVTTWIWRSPVAQPMGAGDSGAMCSDKTTRLLLVGGNYNSGRSNSVWTITASGVDTFTLASTGGVRPAAREGHSMIAIGLDIFMMLGYDGTTYYNDVWKYTTTTGTWKQLSPTGTIPSARAYACSTSRGALIFIQGGENAGGQVSEMMIFNTKTSEWRTLTTTGTSPGARSHHSCFFYSDELLVTGLGTLSSGRDTQWFVYEIGTQAWYVVSPMQSTYPAARQDYVGFSPTGQPRVYVALGIGSVTYNDRWLMTNLVKNTSTATYSSLWTSLTASIPSTGTSRQYIRGAAAAVLTGQRMIVCGGALSSSFPAALDNICFSHDFNTGLSEPFSGASLLATGSAAVYVGQRVYMFGGRLCSATVLRDLRINTMQVFQLDSASLCPFGQSSDVQCVHCAPGSVNPTCTPVPAGYYSWSPWNSSLGCDAGSYSSGLGSTDSHFCFKCAQGTYSNITGSSSCTACTNAAGCAIGSISNALTAAPSFSVAPEVQPAALGSLQVPWALIGIIIGGLVLLFALFFVYLQFISDLTLRHLDIFSDGHRSGKVNQPFRAVATTYGGFFSILYILGTVSLVATLVLAHFYENIQEIKSGVPTPVIRQQFPDVTVDGDITFTVTISGPLRSLNGVSVTAASQCVVLGTSNQCVGSASFDSNSSKPHAGTFTQLTCSVASDGSCTMNALCLGCGFEAGKTSGVVLSFGSAYSASVVRYSVSSTTGIRNPTVSDLGQVDMLDTDELRSTISGIVTPSSSYTVFSGLPAVTVPIDVTPTYFVSPKYVSESQSSLLNVYTDSGYHLESANDAVVQGNTVDPQIFDQYYGVSINFQLSTVASSVLLVQRILKVSDAQFVSSLLGAVAGIISVTLVVINFFDKDVVKRFFKKRLGDTCPALRCCWVDLDELGHEEEEEEQLRELKKAEDKRRASGLSHSPQAAEEEEQEETNGRGHGDLGNEDL